MEYRRLTAAAALLLSAALAYLLQDVVRTTIILPAVYIIWVAGIYYRSVPQFLTWAVAVAVIFFLVMDSLLPDKLPARIRTIPYKPNQGTLEKLAGWFVKAPGGVYYKWLIANRLGSLARDLLEQKQIPLIKRTLVPINPADTPLPDSVREYLETGLYGSFADHPRPRLPWVSAAGSPLDLDPMEVMDHLELIVGERK
jgi:hypothetical protein